MTVPTPALAPGPMVPPHLAFMARGGIALQSSRRRVDLWVAYATMYEFEDVIAAVTSADRIDAVDADVETGYRRLYRLTRKLADARAAAAIRAPARVAAAQAVRHTQQRSR